ncbi:hypothetical protein ED733_004372 [Metarhizium rileyi]|uniref:Uncharacterized protein n=1 Tax=Metarhizium rileyi (strain RCEF 4871) TaxID=1649241 RepID=A0A5C6G7S0_METRR|nr:hypothetical protein ED733_004372 [Metarhizium rileyi]
MSIQRLPAGIVGLSRSALAPRIPAPRSPAIRWFSTGPATVVDTGFWRALIPKPLRRENRKGIKESKTKGWNPATFFIVMFLFIGSMSIQMIALRNQSARYNRQSTVRIAKLQEALRKLQNNEEVNLDKLLVNTEESQKDVDWEEMLKAIEENDESQKANQAAKSRQIEAPTMTMTSKTLERESNVDNQPVKTDTQPSKPESASLGNFF